MGTCPALNEQLAHCPTRPATMWHNGWLRLNTAGTTKDRTAITGACVRAASWQAMGSSCMEYARQVVPWIALRVGGASIEDPTKDAEVAS
jgi:hypothetical protein